MCYSIHLYILLIFNPEVSWMFWSCNICCLITLKYSGICQPTCPLNSLLHMCCSEQCLSQMGSDCELPPLLSSGSGSAVDALASVCGQIQVVSMHEDWECVHMRDRIVFVTQEGSTSHCTRLKITAWCWHRLIYLESHTNILLLLSL